MIRNHPWQITHAFMIPEPGYLMAYEYSIGTYLGPFLSVDLGINFI